MSVKIGLALSGGGGCGFAHVGVLQVLLEHGIDISYVAGTSMGSIVGGMFASGLSLKDLLEIVENFKKKEVIDLNILTLLKKGLISGNKLEKYLEDNVLVKNIEDFKIPFTAVTVDILTGKQVLLNEGSVAFAMRASSAVPAVFSSCPYKDKILVDGGILNNLPQDVVKNMGADYVVAVDCLGNFEAKEPPKNVLNSLINSLNIMICNNMKRSQRKCNTLIKVNILKNAKKAGVANLDKEAIEEAIEMGKRAAIKKINKILKDIKILEEKENLNKL